MHLRAVYVLLHGLGNFYSTVINLRFLCHYTRLHADSLLVISQSGTIEMTEIRKLSFRKQQSESRSSMTAVASVGVGLRLHDGKEFVNG